jgi:excisionase family DNA binding protein
MKNGSSRRGKRRLLRRRGISPAPAPRSRPVTKLRTIQETAELFDASRRTVQRLIQSGALPAYRVGRLVRIADADIAAFLAGDRTA